MRVFRSLKKELLTQGPTVDKFEKSVCDFVGGGYALAVNSATSALHVACLALELGPGDILWTSSISFVASANCGLYCGATVDFVDVDPLTWNISIKALREKLMMASASKKLPKVVVVVHLGGEPADLRSIWELSQRYGFQIIEDAAHALGSQYEGENIGSGKFSAITVFSFHAIKNITTGEGGMVVTNDKHLAVKMRGFRSHGITRNPQEFQKPENQQTPWHYEQQSLGFNYRMTDFQAALGLSQLRKLLKFNKKRRRIQEIYAQSFKGMSEITPQRLALNSTSAMHVALFKVKEFKREGLAKALKNSGYSTSLHYPPIHLQPYYSAMNVWNLVESETYGRQGISLPCHPSLRRLDQKRIIKIVKSLLG